MTKKRLFFLKIALLMLLGVFISFIFVWFFPKFEGFLSVYSGGINERLVNLSNPLTTMIFFGLAGLFTALFSARDMLKERNVRLIKIFLHKGILYEGPGIGLGIILSAKFFADIAMTTAALIGTSFSFGFFSIHLIYRFFHFRSGELR